MIKNHSVGSVKLMLFLVVTVCFITAIQVMAESVKKLDGIPEVFVPVYEKLVARGGNEDVLRSVFTDKRVVFLPHALKINIKYTENPDHYKKFTRPSYIKLGRQFIKQHSDFMRDVEMRYGVSPEIITAILLIETKLGQKTGKYSVFNVLATVATANDETNVEANYKRLKSSYPNLKKEEIAKRLKSRSSWAFKELETFIRFTLAERMDPLKIKGSWAGAFGIPQFIPSSYVAYGVDGDADGVRDLSNFNDAIASVANYLKKHGWKPGMDDEQKKGVIWKYNHSKLYVNAVLASAKLMTQTGDKR